MANKAYDYLCSRLAEIFVNRFNNMLISGSQKMVGTPFPQQNLDGRLFDGTNALLSSMVATSCGYGIPIWMTMNRKDELGLQVKKGEHSIPILHYDVYFIEKSSGKRVPSMSISEFNALPLEEMRKYDRRCYLRFYLEFNIAQTNFEEVYPEKYAELVDFFGFDRRSKEDFSLLDTVIRDNTWECPIEVTGEVSEATYYQNSDRIRIAPKSAYVNEHEFYNDLLYALARSTGSEMRLDRVTASSAVDGMTMMAREALVCELAASTVGSVIGLETTLSDHSANLMSIWIKAIQANPNIIYSAVMDASRASDMIIRGMGWSQREGFDLTKTMASVESAEKARRAHEESKERKKAKAAKKKHSRFVKISEAGKKAKAKKEF